MSARLRLILAFLLLAGGGLYLWMKPAPSNAPAPQAPPVQQSDVPAANYVLAVSWQPAFCETHSTKPECRNEPASHATQFTLHGLWPEDEYCGVSQTDIAADKSGDWSALPAPLLTPETRSALNIAMPGTQSKLERHEWIKHGTCAGVPAEDYFSAALALLADLNKSPVPKLFAANLGASLTLGEIRDTFDQTYSAGAGNRIRLSCSDDGQRRLITEITIGLRGAAFSATPLKTLMAPAGRTDGGCNAGIVDRLGAQ